MTSDGPTLEEVENLFRQAGSLKNQYPEELIVPDNFIPKDQFRAICDIYRITVREVPAESLGLIVDEIKDSFEDYLERNNPKN